MSARSAFFYEARLALGWSALLPMLGLPLCAPLTRWLFLPVPGGAATESLVQIFVLLLPLVSGLSAAHLMTIEQEEGMIELRASYPQRPAMLPLARGGLALLLVLLNGLVGLLAFRLVWGALDALAVLLPALPPALLLAGLSLLAGRLARSYWAAAGVVMIYWFLEVQTRGSVSRALFLFQTIWPQMGIAPLTHRALHAGLGLLFLCANLVLAAPPVFRRTRNAARDG